MKPLRVALVGGDPRRFAVAVEGIDLQHFGSARDVGGGELQRLLASIQGGALNHVLVMVRFVGHSMHNRVRDECRRAGVPCRAVPGAGTAVALELKALRSTYGRPGLPASSRGNRR